MSVKPSVKYPSSTGAVAAGSGVGSVGALAMTMKPPIAAVISSGVGVAIVVCTDQRCPDGSRNVHFRSPYGSSLGGRSPSAPCSIARAQTASTSSTSRLRLNDVPPNVPGPTIPYSGYSSASISRAPPTEISAWPILPSSPT